MARRYFSVFKKHVYLLALLIVLVIVSSIASGLLSIVTSVMAGLVMIILGLAVTIWILKTPAKRTSEEGVGN
jgi:ABC-type multidrug transport system permease subunit